MDTNIEHAPSIVVVSGPNGAGKSTTAEALLKGTLAVEEFVNADVIARGLSGFAPEGSAVRAGRIMLARIRELVARGRGRDVDEVLDKELWRKIRATRDHLGTTEVDPGAHDRG